MTDIPIGIGGVAKYNPHLLSAQELKSIFVARQYELNWLFSTIKECEPGHCNQHCLIVGQRGMGKTTLLRRIGLMVEEDPELSQSWLALTFPEEQYTVSNCAELWSNVVGSLADALEARNLPTQQLDSQLLALDNSPKEEREEQALNILNEYCSNNQKRLLLLIDSTDLLLENLREKKNKNQDNNLWRLRNVLQNNPNIFWLGASYKALELDNQYKDSFQDFFHPIELSPMKLSEMQAAMETLAETFGTGRGLKGKEAIAEIRSSMTERPERLRTLRHLTGGIPRTTVKLYELFAASDSDNVRQDLERLLDDMTPLYKARLEALAEQPRKTFAHILEHWNPISLNKLSEASGLENTKLSSQLKRLEMEGFIQKSTLPHTKVNGYEAAERFFNIWYLMRNAPRRLKLRLSWLVAFLRMWYQPAELEIIARHRLNDMQKRKNDIGELEYNRAVAASMPRGSNIRGELDMETYHQLKAQKINLAEFYDLEGEDKPFASLDEYTRRFEMFKLQLQEANIEGDIDIVKELKQRLLTNLNLTLQQKQELLNRLISESANQFYSLTEVLKELRRQITIMNYSEQQLTELEDILLNNVFCPEFVNDEINAIQLKKSVFKHPVFWHQLSNWERLLSVAAQKELVNYGLEHNTPLYPVEYIEGLAKLLALSVDQKGLSIKVEEQLKNGYWSNYLILKLFKNLVKYQANENLLDRIVKLLKFRKMNSREWNIYACDLMNNNYRLEDCEKDLKGALDKDKNHVGLMHALGFLYHYKLKRPLDAEQAYRKTIELDVNHIHVWNNLGNLYQQDFKRYLEAEKLYNKAISLNESNYFAWNGLGYLYREHLQMYSKSELSYNRAIELNEKYTAPWIGLGDLYHYNLHRYQESEQAYKKAIELDESDTYSLLSLGNLYRNYMQRYQDSEQVYKKVIELDDKNAYSWYFLGNLYQCHLQKYQESEQAFLQAIELNKSYDKPWLGLGNLYQDYLHEYSKAEKYFRKALQIDDKDPCNYVNLARCLWKLNKKQESVINLKMAVKIANALKYPNVLLHSHLILENTFMAKESLEYLAKQASNDNTLAFHFIKEQCWELQQLEKGIALADLMATSTYADYLRPFEIALRYCNGDKETIKGFAPEIKELALDIVSEIEKRLPKSG